MRGEINMSDLVLFDNGKCLGDIRTPAEIIFNYDKGTNLLRIYVKDF